MSQSVVIDFIANDKVSGKLMQIGESLNFVGGAITRAFTAPIMNAWKTIAQTEPVKKALEPIQKAFAGITNELANVLVPIIQELTPAFMDLAKTMVDMVKSDLSPFLKELVPTARDLVGYIRDLVTWFAGLDPQVKKNILSFIAIMAVLGPVMTTMGQLIQVVGKLWTLFGSLGPAISWIGTTALPVLATAFGAITAPVWLLVAAITALVAEIVVFGPTAWQTVVDLAKIWVISIRRIWEVITSWVKSLGQVRWGDIGKNIIMGIVNGITSATVYLVSSLKNALDLAIKEAKAKLGIKSPSVIFRGIGSNMMAGMAQGISADSNQPVRAVISATDRTRQAASNSVNIQNMSISGGRIGREEIRQMVRTSMIEALGAR